jgi:hypothetical protein
MEFSPKARVSASHGGFFLQQWQFPPPPAVAGFLTEKLFEGKTQLFSKISFFIRSRK